MGEYSNKDNGCKCTTECLNWIMLNHERQGLVIKVTKLQVSDTLGIIWPVGRRLFS